MPAKSDPLTRRERQIMDIIYARGEATAAEVNADLPDQPSYSTVRTLLRILEEKGHVKHREESQRFIYTPTKTRAVESKSALRRVVQTFFEGSFSDAVAALVDTADEKLPAEELKRIETIIKKAKAKQSHEH